MSPIIAFRRTATCDTEVGGRKIRAGDKVVLLYQSANRDPAAWSDPDVFQIDRVANEHLAFGIGTHFCLGANLARQEIRIVLEETLWRLSDIRLDPAQPPQRVSSPLVYGLETLPIEFRADPEPQAAAS